MLSLFSCSLRKASRSVVVEWGVMDGGSKRGGDAGGSHHEGSPNLCIGVLSASELSHEEAGSGEWVEDASSLPSHCWVSLSLSLSYSHIHLHSYPPPCYRLHCTDEILMVLLGRIMNMEVPGVVCMCALAGVSTLHSPMEACNKHVCVHTHTYKSVFLSILFSLLHTFTWAYSHSHTTILHRFPYTAPLSSFAHHIQKHTQTYIYQAGLHSATSNTAADRHTPYSSCVTGGVRVGEQTERSNLSSKCSLGAHSHPHTCAATHRHIHTHTSMKRNKEWRGSMWRHQ